MNFQLKEDPELQARVDRFLDIADRAVRAWENLCGVVALGYARITDALDRKASNGNTRTTPGK